MTLTAGTREYNSPEICRMTGITYRQIDFWARTGLLAPSIQDANGSGTQRRYSETDLRALIAIKAFVDSGLSLKPLRWIGTLIESIPLDASGFLVIVGDRARLVSDTQLADLMVTGEVAHVLYLDPMEQS